MGVVGAPGKGKTGKEPAAWGGVNGAGGELRGVVGGLWQEKKGKFGKEAASDGVNACGDNDKESVAIWSYLPGFCEILDGNLPVKTDKSPILLGLCDLTAKFLYFTLLL